ncbi:MAG: acyloxyacyl hydrolase [Gemmatimonadaceae bacterium]
MPKNPWLFFSATLALMTCLYASSLAAQEATSTALDSITESPGHFASHAPSSFGAWGAAARHSEFHTRTGSPSHRNFYLASFRLAWPLGHNESSRLVSASYFIDLIPAALSTDMPEYRWTTRCRPDTLCPGATPIPHDVYGFGVAPIGWAVAIGRGAARLTIEASGGGLWFSRRIPDPVATRFNFTASAGPALELRLTPSQSLRAGYLWHHTSNGGTGKVNPGLNSGILALGVLWHASDGAAQ